MVDVLKVSEEMIRQAQVALRAHQVLKATPTFEVLKMPRGPLEHLSLIIFSQGNDANPDELRGNMFFPVVIDGCKAYFLAAEQAMNYGSDY
jgi:hypothetical protein